jgi:hypothetical protein
MCRPARSCQAHRLRHRSLYHPLLLALCLCSLLSFCVRLLPCLLLCFQLLLLQLRQLLGFLLLALPFLLCLDLGLFFVTLLLFDILGLPYDPAHHHYCGCMSFREAAPGALHSTMVACE